MTETTEQAVTEVAADPRAAYIEGLRILADALEAHPEAPLPINGRSNPITFSAWAFSTDDPRGLMATVARALPCRWDKDANGAYFHLVGKLAGLEVQVIADRDAVCERVVTGTETVTKEVPDPEALAAVPTTTVTEEVEIFEWRCAPILAGAVDTAVDGAA